MGAEDSRQKVKKKKNTKKSKQGNIIFLQKGIIALKFPSFIDFDEINVHIEDTPTNLGLWGSKGVT